MKPLHHSIALEVRNLSYQYGSYQALNQIDLFLKPSLISILGPNGSGKSTLLKCIAGVLRAEGAVFFRNDPVPVSRKHFYGDQLSYLPQQLTRDTGMTVFELVLLGLIRSLSLTVSDEQLERVEAVLKELHIQHLSMRYLNELSGGQQQVVAIAQAIVSRPRVLVLDEPLNNLDIHHQFEVLEIIRAQTTERGMITLMASHDLNLAARYSDRVIIMNEGKLYQDGLPEQVITAQMLEEVYHIRSEVHRMEGGLLVQPMGILT